MFEINTGWLVAGLVAVVGTCVWAVGWVWNSRARDEYERRAIRASLREWKE